MWCHNKESFGCCNDEKEAFVTHRVHKYGGDKKKKKSVGVKFPS